MPVMGLIFLRHAYSRYLSVKDGIDANMPKRGGKTRALSKEISPGKVRSSCGRGPSSTPWSA